MVSPGLCDKLLFDHDTFEDFARKLQSSLVDRSNRASVGYYSFVQEEAGKVLAKPFRMDQSAYDVCISCKWLAFNEECIEDYFKMPGGDTVQKIFND